MKILRGGGAQKIFRHPKGRLKKIKGGYENLHTPKPTGRGGGLLKFQAWSFNIFIRPRAGRVFTIPDV